jgi:hypothetical protein
MQAITKKLDLTSGNPSKKGKIRGFFTMSEDERLLEDSFRPGL